MGLQWTFGDGLILIQNISDIGYFLLKYTSNNSLTSHHI
jgi:hypothetical protein